MTTTIDNISVLFGGGANIDRPTERTVHPVNDDYAHSWANYWFSISIETLLTAFRTTVIASDLCGKFVNKLSAQITGAWRHF